MVKKRTVDTDYLYLYLSISLRRMREKEGNARREGKKEGRED